MNRGLIDTVRQLLRLRWIPIVLVTLFTLGIVAAVLLTTTSAGCGVGIKSSRCLNTGPVASVRSPSASTASPSPFNPPPYNPGASANPPYNPGASAYPPYNPGASAGRPYANPASGDYPPMANPASGSNTGALGLSCRIPVYANGPGSGGFIVLPGNTFVADPRSAVSVPSPSPGSPSPTPQMGGYNNWFGTTYDAAYSKWLPVYWRWVSPDGAHYAYALGGDVYVQSVAGGTQLQLGKGQNFNVLDVDNNGVYVVVPNQPGLWYLPFSGAAKQITQSNFWQGVSHGYAYGTVTSQVPQGATNTILRLDIQGGNTVAFFSQEGGQSALTGFDAQGHPIIQVNYPGGNYYPGGVALYIATGPNLASLIAVNGFGMYYNLPFPYGTPIADSHGLWFTVGNGVVLYANGAWYAASNIGGQLAGGCV